MQLRNARLCLDCEEIHDGVQCPLCASETFAFIKRWVPAPERRSGSRAPEEPGKETLEAYRTILHAPEKRPATTWRLVKGGAVSLAFLAAAGWLWQRSNASRSESPAGADKKPPSRDPAKQDRETSLSK
jgi:hypothetical protein